MSDGKIRAQAWCYDCRKTGGRKLSLVIPVDNAGVRKLYREKFPQAGFKTWGYMVKQLVKTGCKLSPEAKEKLGGLRIMLALILWFALCSGAWSQDLKPTIANVPASAPKHALVSRPFYWAGRKVEAGYDWTKARASQHPKLVKGGKVLASGGLFCLNVASALGNVVRYGH